MIREINGKSYDLKLGTPAIRAIEKKLTMDYGKKVTWYETMEHPNQNDAVVIIWGAMLASDRRATDLQAEKYFDDLGIEKALALVVDLINEAYPEPAALDPTLNQVKG